MSTESQETRSSTTTEGTTKSASPEMSASENASLSAIISVRSAQRFLDAIRPLGDEFQLTIAKDGLTADLLTPGTAMKGEARLTTNAFESFEATSGVVGVPIKRLREITRMSSNSDLLHLELDSEAETLDVQAGTLACSLQLSDPSMIPSGGSMNDVQLPSVVVMEGGKFKRIVRGADHVDSSVLFEIQNSPEQFIATADNGDDRLVAPRGPGDVSELLTGGQSVGSNFDLSYLKQARRAIRKRTEVTLALGTNQPLALAFDIADGAGQVEYGIAPVVEAE